MPHYSVKPISLVLRPSYYLTGLFALAVFVACLCIAIVPINPWLRLFICVLVVLAGIYVVSKDGLLRLPNSLIKFEISAKGTCTVTNPKGEVLAVTVHDSSFVAAYFTVLNLQSADSRRLLTMLISPDRVEPDVFRRLRVYLRWAKFQITDSVDALGSSV